MDVNIRACIINAALGKWYPKGQERLKNSLIHHGFNWDMLTWTGWPNDNFDKGCPYNIKAAAFEEAINRGYTHILWLDCSVWAVRDPNPMFDMLNYDGYYFWKNGYNCAQECSDACLQYFGIDRDTAEQWPVASTSMFGINLLNPAGAAFIDRWLQSARDKVFHGSRLHDNQSTDPRFLWHRQDQSAASIIANQMRLKMHEPMQYSMYYEAQIPESVIFVMRGM